MKHILHILNKDLRRYAWAWVTLLACAAIEVYLHGTTAGLLNSDFNNALSMLSSMIGGILFFIVIVMVVQEETLVDPDAYWLSRPIARGKLLASKLIFLFSLIAIYKVSETITLILNDGTARIPFALLGLLGALAVWQAQVFLAAQTRSLPRYLLLVVSIFVGFYALMFGLMFLVTAAIGFDFDFDWGQLPSTLPAHWLALIQTGYWLLVGLGLLLLIYCRRRILAAWLLLIPAALIAGILTPNDQFLGFDTTTYFDSEKKGLQLLHLDKGNTMQTAGDEFVEVRAVFALSDELASRDVWAVVSSSRVRHNGSDIELNSDQGSQRFREERSNRRSIRLGYAKRDELRGDESDLSVEFSLALTFSEQIPVDSLEIAEGATHVGGGNRLVIRSILQDDDELSIRFAGSVPTYAFEPRATRSTNEPFDGRFSFALANRGGQALRDFRLSQSWSGMGNISEGKIETFLPEDASPSDYLITVFAREITGTAFDYIRQSSVSFKD